MSRGRWIFDRKTESFVPAGEYYARKYADVAVSDLAAPMVMKDVEPYRSVIDGSVIGGRRQHRDHLKAHGCIEVGNEMPTHRPTSTLPPVAQDIQRAMQDEGLRKEAVAAEKRANEALASVGDIA